MKKIFDSLLGRTRNGANASSGPKSLDPSSILFSVPTISNDLAPIEPLEAAPQPSDLMLHEDDWAQVEFFPKGKLAEVQAMLAEYKSFEAENRAQYGWRKTYVRTLERESMVRGEQPLDRLQSLLGSAAGAGPIVHTSGEIVGRVKDGFSLPLGGNVTLYGYVADGKVPVLSAFVGENADNGRLVDAFAKLNASEELILVDWRQQLILISIREDGKIEAYRP